jgi:hypothetical protein
VTAGIKKSIAGQAQSLFIKKKAWESVFMYYTATSFGILKKSGENFAGASRIADNSPSSHQYIVAADLDIRSH